MLACWNTSSSNLLIPYAYAQLGVALGVKRRRRGAGDDPHDAVAVAHVAQHVRHARQLARRQPARGALELLLELTFRGNLRSRQRGLDRVSDEEARVPLIPSK